MKSYKTPYLCLLHKGDKVSPGGFHLGTDFELARDICREYVTYRIGVTKVELTDNDWKVIETFEK